MALRRRSGNLSEDVRGWRNPTAPAVSSKLVRSAPRRATPVSSPDLEKRRRKVSVVDYHIHHSSHPYVLFRVVVLDHNGDRTLHRRYNDFFELHRCLTRLFGNDVTRDLGMPGKRVFKRRKFDPAFLEERKAGLEAYLQKIMGSPELRMSEPVRDFLSDAWRQHMEAMANRGYSFLSPDYSFFRGVSASTPGAASNGIASAGGSSLQRTRSRSLMVPPSGNVLSPPQLRRASSPDDRPLLIRPRGLRRPPARKMPIPLNIKSDLHHPVYIAIPPRLLELRREFDTEKQYVSHGTPPARVGDAKTRTSRPDVAPLPPPPKGFFDDHFPATEVIKKQQAFLKEYHRRRFVKPGTPKPP